MYIYVNPPSNRAYIIGADGNIKAFNAPARKTLDYLSRKGFAIIKRENDYACSMETYSDDRMKVLSSIRKKWLKTSQRAGFHPLLKIALNLAKEIYGISRTEKKFNFDDKTYAEEVSLSSNYSGEKYEFKAIWNQSIPGWSSIANSPSSYKRVVVFESKNFGFYLPRIYLPVKEALIALESIGIDVELNESLMPKFKPVYDLCVPEYFHALSHAIGNRRPYERK